MEISTLISTTVLPLTTAFTPAPSCFNDIGWYSTSGDSVVYATVEAGNSCVEPTCWFGLPSSSDCFPSGWGLSATYSPGVCPAGYSVACSSLASYDTVLETIGICCPSGYTCLAQKSQPWFSTEPCAITYSPGPLNLTVLWCSVEFNIFTVTPKNTLTYASANFDVYAHSVQVRWQNAPPTILTTANLTTFSTFAISSASPTPVPSLTPMPSPTSQHYSISTTSMTPATSSTAPPNSGGNPSSDALALEGNRIALGVGLGVGIGIGLPSAIVAILTLWRWGRNPKKRMTTP